MKKFFGFVFIAAIIGVGINFAKNPMKNPQEEGSQDFSSRDPSQVSSAQQKIIDNMNKIILSLSNRTEVSSAVKQIKELAEKPEHKEMPGVQLYGAIASIVPDLEGIFYRCRAFVETSDWLHMSWLFGLRDFQYNSYLYGPHVQALFDYLTYPSEKAGPSFEKVSDFQNYLLSRIAPKLEAFLGEAQKLEKLPSANFEFQFDRTILVGEAKNLRFLDPEEAKKLFIKPYHYTMMFLLQRTLGTIYYIGAMDLNELPIVFNRVIKATTINTIRGDLRLLTQEPVKGVTPELAYTAIGSTHSFLEWRKDIVITKADKTEKVSAQSLLDKAFLYGRQSAYNQLQAYVCGIKYPQRNTMEMTSKDCTVFDDHGNPEAQFVANGSKYIFNPNSMLLGFKKKYQMLRDRVRAYEDSAKGSYSTIHSDVTGESVQVNLKALFNERRSQRSFLPTGYLAKPASSRAVGLDARAWNYDHGKPIRFEDFTFGGFFNPSEVSNIDSLYNKMRTVLYTDAIAPFAIFIRVPSTAQFFIRPTEIMNAN